MKYKSHREIETTIEKYFQGTYRADASLLTAAFHPDARICGFVSGQLIDVSLNAFIHRVCHEVRHQTYDKKIMALDVQGDIAMVKAKVLVDETFFMDFISLIRFQGQWLIRHKLFTSLKT